MNVAFPRRGPNGPGRCGGFSLMEVIVATAVLAAAGAALLGLIGQASRLALKSQRRTDALQAATTVMEEAIAMRGRLRSGETSGEIAGNPDWSFVLRCEPFRGGGESGRGAGTAAAGTEATRVWRVVVEIFPGDPRSPSGDGGDAAFDAPSTVRLVRLVRVQTIAETETTPRFGETTGAAAEVGP